VSARRYLTGWTSNDHFIMLAFYCKYELEENMKKLIMICGPNGVGKTTLTKTLNRRLMNSALIDPEWCRMINPFYFDDEINLLTISNMTHLLRSYLSCTSINYVIFNYGFHGPRRMIYDNVMDNLKDLDYEFIPIIVTCDEQENIDRMLADDRDEERIKRALSVRGIYDDINYPLIDSTKLTVEETVEKVIEIVSNFN
jgi:cytidylate kinase